MEIRLHDLPENNEIGFDDLAVEVVSWVARDGQPLEGILCERRTASDKNGLIVHAHGGPAVAFAADRSVAANSSRYPCVVLKAETCLV